MFSCYRCYHLMHCARTTYLEILVATETPGSRCLKRPPTTMIFMQHDDFISTSIRASRVWFHLVYCLLLRSYGRARINMTPYVGHNISLLLFNTFDNR